MRPALAPIEAWTAEQAPRAPDELSCDTEALKPSATALGKFARLVSKHNHVLHDQMVGDSDAELPGKVVVTGPSAA